MSFMQECRIDIEAFVCVCVASIDPAVLRSLGTNRAGETDPCSEPCQMIAYKLVVMSKLYPRRHARQIIESVRQFAT